MASRRSVDAYKAHLPLRPQWLDGLGDFSRV